MGFPYTFAKRPTERLGVGVSDMAFGRPSTLPLLDWKSGGLGIRRMLAPLQPAQVFAPHTVTDVSLRGAGGVYLSDQLTLQGLMDLEARQKSKNGRSY